MTDAEIISAVLRGESELYGELVRAHQARVRLVCLVYLGHKEEADDAAQDVFIKAYQALRQYKGQASFLTWLIRITDNHCRDLLRSRTRRPTDSLDALLESQGDLIEGRLERLKSGQEARAYTPEDFEFLGRLFNALPQDDREILLLKEIEQLSYDEIANRLKCSLDAVKGRLKRARQNLIEKCARFFSDTSALSPRL